MSGLSHKLRRTGGGNVILEFVASSNTIVTNDSTITLNKPTGTSVGDLMVVVIGTTSGSTGSTFTYTATGWTLLATEENDGDRFFRVLFKYAEVTDGSSFTFTSSGGNSGFIGSISTWKNAKIGLIGEAERYFGAHTITAPEILIPTDNSILFGLFHIRKKSVSISSSPSGMSLLDDVPDGGLDTHISLFYQNFDAGLTGTKTITWTGSTNDDIEAVLFSIVPSSYNPVKPTFVASATTQNTSSSITQLTIDKPSGTQEGDLMIAFMATTSIESWTGDTDWTEFIDEGGNRSCRGAWKIATASEPSSYTFTTGTTTNTPAGAILTYRNAAYSNNSTIKTTNSNLLDITSIMVDTNYSIIIAFGSLSSPSKTYTHSIPSNAADIATIWLNNDGTSPSQGIFTRLVGYGLTSQMKLSSNSGGLSSSGFSILIKPN